MNDLIKASDHAMTEVEFKPLLDAFMEKLNVKPNPSAIKRNPYSGNAEYIPVSIIENYLDSIFMGLWKTDHLKYSVEVNSVLCSLELHVFHPVLKIWLTRTGTGAIPIEMNKTTKDLAPKGLHKNFPAAESFALKKAAKSLGRRFGRDLGRSESYDFKADTPNYNNILNDEKTV